MTSDYKERESITGLLAQVRNSVHTPGAVGVLMCDHLLSEGPSVGSVNMAKHTLEVPMTATIRMMQSEGPAPRRVVVTCIKIGGYSVCVTTERPN